MDCCDGLDWQNRCFHPLNSRNLAVQSHRHIHHVPVDRTAWTFLAICTGIGPSLPKNCSCCLHCFSEHLLAHPDNGRTNGWMDGWTDGRTFPPKRQQGWPTTIWPEHRPYGAPIPDSKRRMAFYRSNGAFHAFGLAKIGLELGKRGHFVPVLPNCHTKHTNPAHHSPKNRHTGLLDPKKRHPTLLPHQPRPIRPLVGQGWL